MIMSDVHSNEAQRASVFLLWKTGKKTGEILDLLRAAHGDKAWQSGLSDAGSKRTKRDEPPCPTRRGVAAAAIVVKRTPGQAARLSRCWRKTLDWHLQMVSYEYPTGIQRTRSGEHRNTQAAWPGLKETSNTQDFNALLRLDLHVEGPTCRPTLAQPRYHCFSRYRRILLVAPLLTDFYTAQISEHISPKQRFDILASYHKFWISKAT